MVAIFTATIIQISYFEIITATHLKMGYLYISCLILKYVLKILLHDRIPG